MISLGGGARIWESGPGGGGICIDCIVRLIVFMETTTVNNEWALNGLAHASCVCLSFRD